MDNEIIVGTGLVPTARTEKQCLFSSYFNCLNCGKSQLKKLINEYVRDDNVCYSYLLQSTLTLISHSCHQ